MEVIVGTYEQSICALNFCFDEIEAVIEFILKRHLDFIDFFLKVYILFSFTRNLKPPSLITATVVV